MHNQFLHHFCDQCYLLIIFTVRLQMHMHALAIDICLSVHESVKCVDCDKTK